MTAAWWTGAVAVNASICALVGAAIGTGAGYSYAQASAPCVNEPNPQAVTQCASRSSDLGQGAFYGAAGTAAVGVLGTACAFFKNPTKKNAQIAMAGIALGVGFCCNAISSR